MDRPITGFYHVWVTPTSKNKIIPDQLKLLRKSGLLEQTQNKFCCVLGDPGFRRPTILRLQDAGFTVLKINKNPYLWEDFTLEAMRKFVKDKDEESDVWYVHTKGTRWKGNAFIKKQEIRKRMEYAIVHKWEECVRRLMKSDVCGTRYRPRPLPHYSGNFWWAKSEYLQKLPPIQPKPPRRANGSKDRYWAEFWLFKSDPKFVNIGLGGFDQWFQKWKNTKKKG